MHILIDVTTIEPFTLRVLHPLKLSTGGVLMRVNHVLFPLEADTTAMIDMV